MNEKMCIYTCICKVFDCSIGNWVRSCEMSTHVLMQHNTLTRLDSNSIFSSICEDFLLCVSGNAKPFFHFILLFLFRFSSYIKNSIRLIYTFSEISPQVFNRCTVFRIVKIYAIYKYKVYI